MRRYYSSGIHGADVTIGLKERQSIVIHNPNICSLVLKQLLMFCLNLKCFYLPSEHSSGPTAKQIKPCSKHDVLG